MSEVLVQFTDPVISDGVSYTARACGAAADDGRWQGWIEFTPDDGGEVLRSARETTQPNREDTVYWATGLSAVYLEGALQRTTSPRTLRVSAPAVPAFDGPAPAALVPSDSTVSILDPFSVYRKGEALLRRQLGALSAWHLVNVIQSHGLSAQTMAQLNALDQITLIEIIVSGVREQSATRP